MNVYSWLAFTIYQTALENLCNLTKQKCYPFYQHGVELFLKLIQEIRA